MAVNKYFDTWFDTEFTYEDVDLSTHGKKLFFQKVSTSASDPKKNMILAHGLTANSKIMDIQYKGYSLARIYANAGYTTWLIDMSGHGGSEAWEDGRQVKTKTAAEDIIAAAEKIRELQGVETIDTLGWSWGTMTTSAAQMLRPDLFRKMVLLSLPTRQELSYPVDESKDYAEVQYGGVARLFPIKNCPGGMVPPPDFEFDESRVEIGLVNKACHDFFRYVADRGKPIGPTIEIMSGALGNNVDLEKMTCPVFIAYGDDDMYVNVEMMEKEYLPLMPEGSKSFFVPGGTHAIPYDKRSPILHYEIQKWLAE